MKRCIYLYEFEDKTIYIGLTNNLKKRNKQHLNLSKPTTVGKYLIKNKGVKFELKQLTDYVEEDDAIELEKELIIEYCKNGYNVINKSEGGELGGNLYTYNIKDCSVVNIKKELKKAYDISFGKGEVNNMYFNKCFFLMRRQLENLILKELCSNRISFFVNYGEDDERFIITVHNDEDVEIVNNLIEVVSMKFYDDVLCELGFYEKKGVILMLMNNDNWFDGAVILEKKYMRK